MNNLLLGILLGTIPIAIWNAIGLEDVFRAHVPWEKLWGILEHGHWGLLAILLGNLLHSPILHGFGLPFLLDEHLLDEHPWNWKEGPMWRFYSAISLAIILTIIIYMTMGE